MVDSIGNIGGIQGIGSGNKPTNTARTEEKRENQTVTDDVSLSREALSLSQAEKVAEGVRAQLSEDSSLSLGLNEGFDETI